MPAPDDDEMALIVEEALQSSQDSLVAHLLVLKFFLDRAEWDAVVQVAEAGLGVLRRIQAEIGRGLPR